MADIASTVAVATDLSSPDRPDGCLPDTAAPPRALAAVYALFFAGGVAALVYEVMWMRGFRLVFGSSSQSAAVVLAAFFGGMAIGNLLGARLAKRSSPIWVYGWLEIAVGISALWVGGWLLLYRVAYPLGYDWLRTAPTLLFTGKLLLALVALLPPTIAMGATLPILSRAVVDRPERVARRTGWLYTLNVLGAVGGAWLAGFYLPMVVGVSRTVYVAVAINFMIGAAALLLSRRWPPLGEKVSGTISRRQAEKVPDTFSTVLLAAAAISGFGSLALEVIYVRMLAQRTDGSVYAFALMLMIFLLCLAAGAWVVSRWLDRRNPWRFLAWTQLAAAGLILVSTALYPFLPWFAAVSLDDTYAIRTGKLGIASLLLLGPPVLLIGIVLPWTWKVATHDAADVARSVGVLTGVNTVAAVCGSLLAGFVLLPWLGLGASALSIAALYAVLALIGFWRASAGFGRWFGTGACVSVVALWYASGLSQPIRQPLSKGETLVHYREHADASVAVIERAGGHRTLKLNHEYTLGSSAGADRELRQGRLPLMLHPDPRRVAFIGAATGITSSAALDFPLERLVAIELVRGVADALPLFERWNAAFYDDPRVELVVDDGRNYLLGTREVFDVVVSDLFVPWHAGTGDLYTVEHFRTVHRRLAEGGMFAQWLPGYQLTVEELRTIAASLVEVFPNSALWRNDFDARYPMICLVGYRDALAFDPVRTAEHGLRLAESNLMRDGLLTSVGGLEMLFVCGGEELRHWTEGALLNTDEYPIIEYTTPMSYLQHRQKENVGPVQNFFAGFRPRHWCYPQQPSSEFAVEDAFRAADILHDANMANAAGEHDEELRLLLQLEESIDKLPAAAMYMTRAAASFQRRRMTERSEELLTALVRHDGAPAEAFVALAALRKEAGNDEQAIDYLEQAVDRAPQSSAVRKQLVDLLTKHDHFDRLGPHLVELLRDTPNDPFLRLDLARALDRQGNQEAVEAQLDEFRARWDGTNGRAVWRYLRSLGLGHYVDAAPEVDAPTTSGPADAAESTP